jgi:hypothetical protein
MELSCENPGRATPGYWMTHPEEWPSGGICIGSRGYTVEEAIELMCKPTKGDKTLTLFPALVAAKLNAMIENDTRCMVEVGGEYMSVWDVICIADVWMAIHPPESGVKASSDDWQTCAEDLYLALDKYNNGELCVLSRDELEMELSWDSPGVGTPGYWMNHPEAWPITTVCIGGRVYTVDEAIELMLMPTAGDKTLTMFQALVAAKLNKAIENVTACPVVINGESLYISGVMLRADLWMEQHPAGSGVAASSGAWQGYEPSTAWMGPGELLYKFLDKYNNGELCVPSRDELEQELD